MFFKNGITTSTGNFWEEISRLKAALHEADAVVIGAGAGLSSAAGFDKKRLFYTQGDYGLFQCSTPCRQETFDNREIIRQMVASQKEMKIPSSLLPVCPRCGKPLTMNLRSDDTFVEDEGWHQAAERYAAFLRARRGQRILFWELGVGYNTPVIIKYPFWQMTAQTPRALYCCVNNGEALCPQEIRRRAICLNGDSNHVLGQLQEPLRPSGASTPA